MLQIKDYNHAVHEDILVHNSIVFRVFKQYFFAFYYILPPNYGFAKVLQCS